MIGFLDKVKRIKMKRFILSLALIVMVFVFAFSQNMPIDNVNFYTTNDLNFTETFKKRKYRKYYNKKYKDKAFKENYYYAWRKDKVEFSNAFAKTPAFQVHFNFQQNPKSPCFQGNYRPIGEEMAKDLNRNINRGNFPNIQQYGIIVVETNVREVPTDEFCFKRVRSAGESYPFDYFQYTTLWLGTPVLVMHQSQDEMWYFIASPYSTGWVHAEDIGLLTDRQKRSIQKKKLFAVTKENTIIKTKYGVQEAQIGTLLPMSGSKVLIPRRYKSTKTKFDKIALESHQGSKMPLEFNAQNTKMLMQRMLGNKYSWGGLGGGRDCSATLKDFFTPFGIWLPRNSSQQCKVGEVTELTGNRRKKFRTIEREAIPFLTIIYKRGHSMLYIGENEDGVPLIFHNAWGLKVLINDRDLAEVGRNREQYGVFGISEPRNNSNEVKSRYIIGQAAITTIEPERDIPRERRITYDYFLDNISSMNVIVK